MLGWRKRSDVVRNIDQVEDSGVKYVNDTITRIDPPNRTVRTSSGNFHYDQLIIALGAELASESIAGFQETAHHIYSLEAAMKLHGALPGFSAGNLAIGVSSLPFKCPAAPYETAFLLDYYLRRRGIREKVNIQFFTPESQPMPVGGKAVGDAVKQLLKQRAIEYHPNHKLKSVDRGVGKLAFETGGSVNFDMLVAVPPHKCPDVVRQAELTNETGWVPVNKTTLRTKYDDTYAIGDVTGIKLPDGMMLPKAGVFAHSEAEVVANNVVNEIEGRADLKEFTGNGSCFLEIGYGKASFMKGNFYAEQRTINPRTPSRIWHWGKVLFEKYWLWKWF